MGKFKALPDGTWIEIPVVDPSIEEDKKKKKIDEMLEETGEKKVEVEVKVKRKRKKKVVKEEVNEEEVKVEEVPVEKVKEEVAVEEQK